jgi:hypothetical protein
VWRNRDISSTNRLHPEQKAKNNGISYLLTKPNPADESGFPVQPHMKAGARFWPLLRFFF